MTSLNNRLAYLGIADFDYLSARILLLDGLTFTGLPKAAEAFEKIVKLVLMLEAKISRNEELTPGALRRFGHELGALLVELRTRTAIPIAVDVDQYFAMLKDAAAHRYPEAWKEYEATLSIGQLDSLYAQLRNLAVANFPVEEKERARCFGTFIGDAYTPETIEKIRELGGRSPWELLAYRNDSHEAFDLDHERRRPRIT